MSPSTNTERVSDSPPKMENHPNSSQCFGSDELDEAWHDTDTSSSGRSSPIMIHTPRSGGSSPANSNHSGSVQDESSWGDEFSSSLDDDSMANLVESVESEYGGNESREEAMRFIIDAVCGHRADHAGSWIDEPTSSNDASQDGNRATEFRETVNFKLSREAEERWFQSDSNLGPSSPSPATACSSTPIPSLTRASSRTLTQRPTTTTTTANTSTTATPTVPTGPTASIPRIQTRAPRTRRADTITFPTRPAVKATFVDKLANLDRRYEAARRAEETRFGKWIAMRYETTVTKALAVEQARQEKPWSSMYYWWRRFWLWLSYKSSGEVRRQRELSRLFRHRLSRERDQEKKWIVEEAARRALPITYDIGYDIYY